MKIWDCKIGEVEEIPDGSDRPMRNAVRDAFVQLTSVEPTFIFSGWDGKLTKSERVLIENREPVAELRTSTAPNLERAVAEARKDERRKTLEEARDTVCSGCRLGLDLDDGIHRYDRFTPFLCRATRIRNLLARDEKEPT